MILQALKREAQNPKHCLDKFTLGAVGEFGRPCDARVHSEDIRRVHGVPQIQTGREQTRVRSEFVSGGGRMQKSTDTTTQKYSCYKCGIEKYLSAIRKIKVLDSEKCPL